MHVLGLQAFLFTLNCDNFKHSFFFWNASSLATLFALLMANPKTETHILSYKIHVGMYVKLMYINFIFQISIIIFQLELLFMNIIRYHIDISIDNHY